MEMYDALRQYITVMSCATIGSGNPELSQVPKVWGHFLDCYAHFIRSAHDVCIKIKLKDTTYVNIKHNLLFRCDSPYKRSIYYAYI